MNFSILTFNKVVALCKRNSILNVEKVGNEVVNVKYGPLGYLLKCNIYKEWLNSLINHSDVHIFPAVIPEPQNIRFDQNADQTQFFMNDILHQYDATLPLISHRLPYGLALKSQCTISAVNDRNKDKPKDVSNPESDETSIMWNLKQWTCKTIAFFCDPKKSMYWFYYWQRQRYLWWRKFSAMPFHFSLSDIIQTPNGDHIVSVQTKYPCGVQKLETVRVFGSDQLETLFAGLPLARKSETESIRPGLILCQTDLDLAAFTYLCNSFEEKLFNSKLTRVLRLHFKLAPYKVSIVINDVHSDSMKRLTEISNRLLKELKRRAVPVLPNPNFKSDLPIQLQFEQFDEMGIPYTIVLYENSLITGIAGLRNRDTTLQEQVHITELTSKILTYLLMHTTVDKAS